MAELTLAYMPIDDLHPDPRNPKRHDQQAIDRSMALFGYVEPVVRDDRTGLLVAGHGRVANLTQRRDSGAEPPEHVMLDEDGRWLIPVVVGWSSESDQHAGGYLVASNRTTELGGWADAELADLLASLDDGVALAAGYDDDDFSDLLASLEAEQPAEPDSDERGGLLGVTDVTMGEPATKVEAGQVGSLSGKHLLVIGDVYAGWPLWTKCLADAGPNALFVPYPEPFTTASRAAQQRPLVMVLPDTFLAGHLLDRHIEANGLDSVALAEGQPS